MSRSVLAVMLVVLALPGTTARGQPPDTPAAVKKIIARVKANAGKDAALLSLQGVKEVRVTVEPLSASATTIGLDTAHIRTLTEGKLRDNGLSLMAPYALGRMDPATGQPLDFHPNAARQSSVIVDVQVTVASLPTGPTAIAVNVWVKQGATLLRDPSIPSLATTWATGRLYVGDTVQDAQAAADDVVTLQLDQLLTAWSSANR